MLQRFALYYSPAADDLLSIRAAQWLGRDASGARFGEPVAGLERTRLDALTVSARRYAFHATIKAPMALADGLVEADLVAALRDFVATVSPVAIGRLKLAEIDGFLALVPERQSDALTHFAAAVVMRFDDFRAPLTRTDRDRRLAGGRLTERHIELLDTFGYPYVFEAFRFHMTLTDRFDAADSPSVLAAARAHFEPVLEREFSLDRLALFHEAAPGAPFLRRGEFVFGGTR